MTVQHIEVPNVNTQGSNSVVAHPLNQAVTRSSYWTVYSPVDAANVLENENFDRQRPVRPFHVKFLAGLMRSGEFQPSEIKFAATPDGRRQLINGQHRLHAIIEAGQSQTLLCTVVPALDAEHVARLYAAEDRILGRTVYDTFNAFGLSEELNLNRTIALRCSAAINLIITGFAGGAARSRVSDQQRVNGLRTWKSELQTWQEIVGAPSTAIGEIGRMNNAPVIAIGLVTLRYQNEMARTFWSAIRANDVLRQGTPERTLADYIKVKMPSAGGQSRLYVTARYIARCWNAYFDGRLHARALPGDLSAPIRIAGTPYDGKTIVLPSNATEIPF